MDGLQDTSENLKHVPMATVSSPVKGHIHKFGEKEKDKEESKGKARERTDDRRTSHVPY